MSVSDPISTLPALSAEQLFAALAGTAPPLVLCPGARQVQALHAAYAQWQLARGTSVWETPLLLGFDGFVEHCAALSGATAAREGETRPPRLSRTETRLLWRLAIGDSASAPLLREADAAQLAGEAWQLAHEYRLSLPFDAGGHADIDGFNQWTRRYRERLARLGAIDDQDLDRELLQALRARRLTLPASCVLAAFAEPTPRQAEWLAALSQTGCALSRLLPPARTAQVQVLLAGDDEQELRAAARWARVQVQAQPAARIGVLVSDLAARRAAVERIFDEQLCPALDAVDAHSPLRPYTLTLGRPLAQFGIVQTALRLLQLCADGLDPAATTALLNSPYWGADAEAGLQRATLDAKLRRCGHPRLDLAALLPLAPAMFQPLQHGMPPRRLRPDEWNEVFVPLLAAAHWPGPRPLDSDEFQALGRWRELLAEFGGIERTLGRVSASTAVAQLREMAERAVFQPQAAETGIQVMSLFEAQGLEFDALWVLGLDDERFPAPGRPQPFIPHTLQRSRGLPHASAAHELAYARAQLAGWQQAADALVLSYARGSEERSRVASPLLAPWLATAGAVQAQELPAHWQQSFDDRRGESLDDARAPLLRTDSALRGGARVLGEQARCPFRGFAMNRIGIRPLQAPVRGLQALDRGNLLHRVLERLWRQWGDQATLLALDDAAREQQLGEAVDAELERLQQEAPQRLQPQLRVLEAARLRELLQHWLAIEAQRPPFRVLAVEAQASADGAVTPFEGLQLKLRPDRIDVDESGRRIILDYKTGAARKPPWADGRPEDPQLLLYALTEQEVGAIAFARLAAGAIGMDGIASDDGYGAGIDAYDSARATRDVASWQALLGRWRGQLATLAQEVKDGWAAVLPKQPRVSCRDCGLHAVCRIRDEISLDEGEEVAT